MATIYEGDNGGSTTTGVSSTEIRVAISNASGSSSDTSTKVLAALFDYFNQRYELYGRRLVPVFVSGSGETPERGRAHAIDIASKSVFAAVTGMHEWNYDLNSTFVATLAHERVLTVARAASSWLTDRVVYDPLHPYVWSVYPSSEDVQRNLADLACRSLANTPARFAGDTELQGRARRFAVLVANNNMLAPVRVLSDALTACTGVEPLRADWTYGSGSAGMRTLLERLGSGADPATTIVCVCDGYGQPEAVKGAASIGFKPEWILTPTGWASGNDEYLVQSNYQGLANFVPPIRLDPGPRILPLQARPWFGAVQSTGLLTNSGSVYGALGAAEFLYPELLLLAAGIQSAGPTLTAETFAQGLMSLQFPNPGAGESPYWQPSAGFGPGDHSLYDNYAVGWWSSAVAALDPASQLAHGSWCFVGQGTRYQVGSYPAGLQDQIFNPSLPCR